MAVETFDAILEAILEQSSPQPPRQSYGFQPGKSGNPWGGLSNKERAARIEAKARELSDGAFDALSARDRELLIQAATLKLQPRRRGEDAVRRANSIARILGRVRGLRAASSQAALPSLTEMMAKLK